ncbi:MAG TPA: TauD/TfdA family dioxygenase [Acidimicrobiales bacterium]
MTTLDQPGAPGSPAPAVGLHPLTASIGAEVTGLDLTRPIDPSTAGWLRQALLDHLVLFFAHQNLTDEEHLALASIFGTPNVYPVTTARGLDQPLEWIEDTPDSPPKTDLWHTDAAFLPEPPEVAVLNMRVRPPVGGDTLWLDLYGAFDGLSPTLQALVSGLELDVHPGETFRRKVELQFGSGIYEKVADEFSGCRQPLVRVHPETGRRALFLCGAYVRGIAGMSAEESDALLGLLRRRLDDPNIACRWRWGDYDVAVWDERCTNHRGLSDHHPAHRLVRRCTVGRSRPWGPDDPPHGRLSGPAPLSPGTASSPAGDD